MALKTLPGQVREESLRESRRECVHHWLIEPPEGPVSTGVCRKCGARQEFENFSPYSTWDNETTASSGHRRNGDVNFSLDAELF